MSNLQRLEQAPGLTPTNICIELARLAERVESVEAIVEIGVYKGRSLCYLAHGARHGGGAHVYGIDPWNLPGNIRTRHKFNNPNHRRAAQLTVRKQGMGKYVTLIRGFSTEEAARWPGPQIGLLHIDGDHSYAAVRGDVLAWATHLAPGAVIAFDDYSGSHNPEVSKAVDQLVEEGVLKPITLVHDRLAVTSLTSALPWDTWEHMREQHPVDEEKVAEARAEIDAEVEGQDEPEFAPADDVIEALEEVVPEEQRAEVTVQSLDESGVPVGEPVDLGENAPAEEPAPEPSLPDPPPRAGAGSGRGPWIDYAVQVTSRPESHWATMARAEIINELERMKVI